MTRRVVRTVLIGLTVVAALVSGQAVADAAPAPPVIASVDCAPGVHADLDVPCAAVLASTGTGLILPRGSPIAAAFPVDEPPVPPPTAEPGPGAAARWAGDLTRRDVVAAGFSDNSSNRQLGDGKYDNPGLPWPIPTVPAPGGRPGRAVRYTLPDNAARLESEPNHRTFLEGDDAWFGFSFYLDRGFPLWTQEFQVIEQLHAAPGSGSPPVGFQAAQGGLVVDGGYGKPGEPDLYRFSYDRKLADLRTERWYDVVYHVHFSQSAEQSVLDVFLDGAPVLLGFHPPGGTVYPPTPGDDRVGTYRKEGLYHAKRVLGGTMYQAGQRLGASYLDAYPRPRSDAPSRP